MTDPWAAPAAIPSTFPNISSFRGRLVLISPRKQETRADNLNPGQTKEVITADVTVVDGAGPVPLCKQQQPTGQFLDGPDFTGVWLDATRVVTQLQDALKSGGKVLARVDTRSPGAQAIKGNPWGLIDPTEQDAQIARNFLATRTVGAAIPPSPAPVAQVPPVYQQQYAAPVAAAPQPVMVPAAPPPLPVPGSAPAGVNPFLRS